MIRIWTLHHKTGGHLHGSGDFSPDAPFFSTREKAETDLKHYGADFEVVELRSLAPSVLKSGGDSYA
jgi:hypothetical protein